ncbi:MAG: hypothetical protein HT580_01875 [Dechloromonas sp.]|nr:MAG: hypothetical protein HT580_01875 [Dechloromonas sp.]
MMDDWIANNTFHRPIRVARLHPEGLFNFHPQLLPPLFDAKVLRITETQLFISGIENFVEGKQVREVAQTWMVSVSERQSNPDCWPPYRPSRHGRLFRLR